MSLPIVLAPFLALFFAAGLVLWVPRTMRGYKWIALTANGLTALLIVYLSRNTTEATLIVEPSAATPALALLLDWSGTAVPFGLMVLAAVSARLLLPTAEDSRIALVGMLAVEAGALAFFASDNWIMVVGAWLIVELGLLLIKLEEKDTRLFHAFIWNLVAIGLWLTAGILMANEGQSLVWGDVFLHGDAALLAFAAVWIRSGLWPLHFAAPSDTKTLLIRMGIPLVLGTYLLTRVVMVPPQDTTFEAVLQIFAFLGVGVSALLALRAGALELDMRWALRALAAPLLVIPFFVDPGRAPAVIVWIGVSAFLATAVAATVSMLRADVSRHRLRRVGWAVAALVGAGVPFTIGFWGRMGLGASALGARNGFALGLLVATATVALIPLWRSGLEPPEEQLPQPKLWEFAALGLVVATALAAGFFPNQIVASFGNAARVSALSVTEALVKSAQGITLFSLSAAILIPPVVAFILAMRWERLRTRFRGLPAGLANVLDLSAPAQGANVWADLLNALVRATLMLLEQPPVAWMVFLAIWVALWVLGLAS